MKFPLVTRAHHEEVVGAMKDQITALAKLLYPQGVPEEFQLLLGIRIEQPAAKAPEPEPEEAPDEKLYRKIKSDNDGFKAKLRAWRRTSPSRIGPAITAELERRALRNAKLAHPAQQVFATAREQVTKP